ncbi:hypothetical protein LCGC14_1610490 [marine sediment metagenome]|uniref:PseI/NeuA/B-like domain-containing protein n=1 Tax=marine sediment metagenome TaxID=412755 RepID=A0A0F9L8P2_9ZZZZ
MNIGPHKLNGKRCFILAEAGTNHSDAVPDDRKEKALHYVERAKEFGADAVKFQIFSRDALFCPLEGDGTRWIRWEKSRMSLKDWEQVKSYAERMGIIFLASAFQMDVIGWLKEMKVPAYKVASRAAKTYPYREVPGPFLISNGFGFKFKVPNSITLQCSSQYPSTVRWKGKHPGFSDHSGSEWTGIDAMARGLSLLEVHFHSDSNCHHGGADEKVCLSPKQMKNLCEARDAFYEMRTN